MPCPTSRDECLTNGTPTKLAAPGPPEAFPKEFRPGSLSEEVSRRASRAHDSEWCALHKEIDRCLEREASTPHGEIRVFRVIPKAWRARSRSPLGAQECNLC